MADINVSIGSVLDVESVKHTADSMAEIFKKNLGNKVANIVNNTIASVLSNTGELNDKVASMQVARSAVQFARKSSYLTTEEETLSRKLENTLTSGINKASSRQRSITSYEIAQKRLAEAQTAFDLIQSTGTRDEKQIARNVLLQRTRAVLSSRFDNVRTPTEELQYRKDELDLLRGIKSETALTRFSVMAAANTASALINYAGTALPSIWGEAVTRNFYASESAKNTRMKAAGSLTGGVLGGTLGAATAFIPGIGPIIAPAATQVLGQAGSTLGGLPGEYQQKRLESYQRTINDVQERMRNQTIYGGAYSTSFGRMVEELGGGSAQDVANMVGNSQTLAARMAFGMVGENEMLMYSLMPEYFAAAMNGASDAELAAAYKRSLQALPPQMRLFAAQSVGGGSAGMYASVMNPYYENIAALSGEARAIDTEYTMRGRGWLAGSAERGIHNLYEAYDYFMLDTVNAKRRYGMYNTQEGEYGFSQMPLTPFEAYDYRDERIKHKEDVENIWGGAFGALLEKDAAQINIYIDGDQTGSAIIKARDLIEPNTSEIVFN